MSSPTQAYRTYKQEYAPYFTADQFGQMQFNPMKFNPMNVFNRYQLAEDLSNIYAADKNAAAMARGETDVYTPSGEYIFTDNEGRQYTPEFVQQAMEAASDVGGLPANYYYDQIGYGESLPEVEVYPSVASYAKSRTPFRSGALEYLENPWMYQNTDIDEMIPYTGSSLRDEMNKARRNSEIVRYIKNHYNTPDSVWRPYVDEESASDIKRRTRSSMRNVY